MIRQLLAVGVLVLMWPGDHCLAADVPTSPQTQQVIERRAPALEHTLQARGLRYGAPIFLRLFKASKELEVWANRATASFTLVGSSCDFTL